MADENKKGITVKIDAALHAQVKEYIESRGMTMAEFITAACDDLLHPKITEKEDKKMENMRTVSPCWHISITSTASNPKQSVTVSMAQPGGRPDPKSREPISTFHSLRPCGESRRQKARHLPPMASRFPRASL